MTISSDEGIALSSATFPKSVQPGIPQLAVPRPGWTTRRFGDLLDVVQRPVRMRNDQEYDLVTVKRSRGGVEKRATLLGSQISVKSQFRIEPEDFLISRRQIVHGACAVVPGEFSGSIVSNEYAVLRCKPDLDLGFLRYLSHSIYFQQTCFHSSIGVHVEKMIFKLDDWLNWPVNVPNIEEQRRIGGGFTSMDAKLDALRQKKSGLVSFKSGLMQRLFSQELRFTRDDGSEFPKWEDKTLGELVDWQSTNTLSREFLTEVSGDFQNIHYGDIHGRFPPLFRQSDAQAPYVATGAPIRSPKVSDFCRPGDVVFADASEDYADIGKAIEVIQVEENTLLAGLHTHLARPKSGTLAVGFTGYLMRTEAVRRQIMRFAQGISVLGISKGNLERVQLKVPQPEEQHKIADALSAMDAKIAAVVNQITHMETFKKGLLQQMFV